MRGKRLETLLLTLLAALLVLASVVGRPNADEGWYLDAGRRVVSGDLLYRDLAFTQSPLLPYVYGAIQAVVPGSPIRVGRATSAVLLVVAAWLAARLAGRLGGSGAGPLALLVLATSPDFLYFGTLVKTYALGGVLLVLAALLTTSERAAFRALAPVPAGLAAATRVSLFPAALLITLIALVSRTRSGDRPPPGRTLLWSIVGLAPFVLALADTGAFFDQTVDFHRRWESGKTLGGQLVEMNRMHTGLALALLLGLPLLARPPRAIGVAAVAIVAFLSQLVAPAHHSEYVVLVVPLLAAAAAAGVTRVPLEGGARRLALVALVVGLAGLGLARVGESYGFREITDRAYRWNPLHSLQAAAAAVDSLSAPGDTLLTWTPAVAVESDRPLPAGLELGHFSPHPFVVAPEGAAPGRGSALAFVEHGIPWRDRPDLDRILADFEPIRYFPGFGQWQETAVLYERKGSVSRD